MYIHEAIKARTEIKPFITREKWCYRTGQPCKAAVKIQPTDSPDGCVVRSVTGRDCPRWQPTTDDLTADDWKTVG